MDWMEIISAHVMWKQRLLAYLAGTSEEKLEPANIQPDNRCALGKWIYGDGQTVADLPVFEEVRGLHAEFHKLAANIVELHQGGDQTGAEALLHGEYSKLSEKLEHRILRLSQQAKSASTGVPRF